MNPRPQYNLLDIFYAPARALSAKQILLVTAALIAGLLVFDFFRYLAFLEQRENMGAVISLYGFFPFDWPDTGSVLAKLMVAIGIGAGLFVIMLGLLAVSSFHIEAVRGNPFTTLRQASRFTRSRIKQVFLSELAVVVFLLVIVFLFAILGLITRIPILGELLFAVLLVIPNFIIAIFAVFIIFVLSASVLVLPAVAAAERRGESFGAILETFSTIIRQPARWLGYTALSAALAKLASFVFAYFAFRALQFVVWSAGIGGGDKIDSLVGSGMSHLPVNTRLTDFMFNLFPGIRWSFSVDRWAPGDIGIAGYLISVMLFLIFASIVAYALCVIAAGQAYTYVTIRKLKDGHNIALEKSLFFEDEHMNPEIDPAKDNPA